jgi:hypothetical protein
MSRFAETDKHVENVEAWAEIIADFLYHASPDRRAAILALAITNEETKAQERGASGRLKCITFSDDWMNSPGVRHRNYLSKSSCAILPTTTAPKMPPTSCLPSTRTAAARGCCKTTYRGGNATTRVGVDFAN